MRNVLKALLMFFSLTCTAWATSDVAAPGAVEESTVLAQAEEGKKAQKEHKYGVFLVVFLVSVLFVLSSATALKRMGGGKPVTRGKTGQSRRPGSQGKLPEGEKRFRL